MIKCDQSEVILWSKWLWKCSEENRQSSDACFCITWKPVSRDITPWCNPERNPAVCDETVSHTEQHSHLQLRIKFPSSTWSSACHGWKSHHHHHHHHHRLRRRRCCCSEINGWLLTDNRDNTACFQPHSGVAVGMKVWLGRSVDPTITTGWINCEKSHLWCRKWNQVSLVNPWLFTGDESIHLCNTFRYNQLILY